MDQMKERLALAIYDIVIGVKDTISLPTHKTLASTTIFSAILTLCSLVSSLLGFYTFLSWIGCLICTAILVILLWIERANNDAIERAYKAAKLHAQKLTKGRQPRERRQS